MTGMEDKRQTVAVKRDPQPKGSGPPNEVRDPRFAELDAEIAEERAAQPAPTKGKRQGKLKPRPRRERADTTGTLDRDVKDFIGMLGRKYPQRIQRRPKPLKMRVLALLRRHLPPYPGPLGRPQESRISKALRMYEDQQDRRGAAQEGNRKKTDWLPIAAACIPSFAKIHSRDRRRAEVVRLRNAAYARLKRQKRKKATDVCQPDKPPSPLCTE